MIEVDAMTTATIENKNETNFLFDRRWRRRVIIVSVLWFLLCLLYGAPAMLFDAMLRKFIPALQLHNVSGSFWNGSAAQAFWQQGDRVIALGSLEWHLQPWSLLWLHPSARVATNYGEQFVDTRVRISPLGQIVLTETSAALSATLLSNWVPAGARGQFALKLERAEFSRAQVSELRGTLYWQQAQWQWNSHWLALGDYRCDLTSSGAQKMQCALQGQGALALDGIIGIDSREHAWSAQLQVAMNSSLPEDFRQGLQVLLASQPDAQGKYSIKREGRW